MSGDLRSAMQARDDGIARAVEHADDVVPKWSDVAVEYVHLFARHNHEFLAEQVRDFALSNGFQSPTDGRAWGAVLRRAASFGYVERAGYAPAKSSNLSAKVLWRSKVCHA